ncbi:MAG: protein adenylyltransferase SelO family protein [Pseudomonadota bacterium]
MESATAKNGRDQQAPATIETLEELAQRADYSLLEKLSSDPEASASGDEHAPRQVFSGHYVPVAPTPIGDPEYVAHSQVFFDELGLADGLARTDPFMQMFSGDLSRVPEPMRKVGWATGYALSIYGTEYYQQCPFGTGNGYGDGRAVSVLEAVLKGQRWEMQLKGGGRTPYCRGADGRAVLRSSVREFLAQEIMHALGVPTSRSLSLYVSKTDTVRRPWYSEGSRSHDPDVMVAERVAIATRVAPSFLRVGQLELFGRRARKQEHPQALQQLEQIVLHAVDREYPDIDAGLGMDETVIGLARAFRERLITLMTHWLRVGYCQGNFNSDNCAVGGFTLDYGPFGFCDRFDPHFQPWTGGGQHFAFWNQPVAAQRNFEMFCAALRPLLVSHPDQMQKLDALLAGFADTMQAELEAMWAAKLGLEKFDLKQFQALANLMLETSVDYTIFFRELSSIPETIAPLGRSFYGELNGALESRWCAWLDDWRVSLGQGRSAEDISDQMKRVNPKYCLREWLLAPAYQLAARGDYSRLRELQAVMSDPYADQSAAVEAQYYRLKPQKFADLGGVSHMSCSS